MLQSNEIPAGSNIPQSINAIIEISAASSPVKYEFDKESSMLFVDRFLHTSMLYPCNYGFIPSTLGGDGDPIDLLLHSSYPILNGAVIKARPIAVLVTEDEKGMDEKIVAVPDTKIDPLLSEIRHYQDLPASLLKQIRHFFEHYKDLEENKWVKVKDWQDHSAAYKIIEEGVHRYKQHS